MSYQEMEFFDAFDWAVPKGFKEPLAFCRFEQGDRLYDTPLAYQKWRDALEHIKLSIQVKLPERAPVKKAEEDADSVFAANWNQRAEIELTIYPKQEKRNIQTTQGRIFMAVWKGDIDILSEDIPAPAIPELPKTLIMDGLLQQLQPCIQRLTADEHFMNPVIFVLPYDETRELYNDKFHKVKTALAKCGDFNIRLVSPEQAGLYRPNGFVPTMSLAFFIVQNTSRDEVFELLKKALYVPSKTKKTEKEFFRINAHGCLYPNVASKTGKRA
jgi:hypothetical protein